MGKNTQTRQKVSPSPMKGEVGEKRWAIDLTGLDSLLRPDSLAVLVFGHPFQVEIVFFFPSPGPP